MVKEHVLVDISVLIEIIQVYCALLDFIAQGVVI
jgi:hypothetical protein